MSECLYSQELIQEPEYPTVDQCLKIIERYDSFAEISPLKDTPITTAEIKLYMAAIERLTALLQSYPASIQIRDEEAQ
jgi:hypothetical protein